MRYYFKDPDLYVDEVVGDRLPPDAVEISETLWRECQQFPWRLGEQGLPEPIKDRGPGDAEIRAQDRRCWRNVRLQRTDHLELPSMQARMGSERRRELEAYRNALRDWPQMAGFPDCAVPVAPAWLTL